jgi:nucleoside-diphosphate-sugar epimerase
MNGLAAAVWGANGFVGSSIVSELRRRGWNVTEITKTTDLRSLSLKNILFDVVFIACNSSSKVTAENHPADDFKATVNRTLDVINSCHAIRVVLISSIDIYSNLTSKETTFEGVFKEERLLSNYGYHKLCTERLFARYTNNFLILRLGGMVGPRMRKGPVFDIQTGRDIFLHPDSQLVFLRTETVARLALELIDRAPANEIFNLTGIGGISLRRIAEIANTTLRNQDKALELPMRVIEVNNSKAMRYIDIPKSISEITDYFDGYGV